MQARMAYDCPADGRWRLDVVELGYVVQALGVMTRDVLKRLEETDGS